VKIACFAWGSLVWDPRTLPRAGPFHEDGLALPIEFSRVSLDGRVTLAIDPSAPLLQSLWVRLSSQTLDAAVDALGHREKIAPDKRSDWVGRHVFGDPDREESFLSGLDDWLEARSLDAVVWTALPCRSPTGELATPSFPTLLAHVESLSGETRARAEQYVRRAPRSVRTPHRARFESTLGWHFRDER
jgi:hypothetical protein